MFLELYTSFKRSCRLLLPFVYKSKKNQFYTLITIFLVIVTSISSSLSPRIIGFIVDKYKILPFAYIVKYVFALVMLWCGEYLLSHINSIIFYAVTNKAIRDIRLDVILHMHKGPYSHKNKFDNAEVVSANDRIPIAVVNFMGKIFINLIPSLMTFISVSFSVIFLIKKGWIYILSVYMTFFPVLWLMKKYILSRYTVWQNSDNVRIMQMESLKSLISSKSNFDSEVPRLQSAFNKEQSSWFINNAYEYLVHFVQEICFFIISGLFLFYFISIGRQGIISREVILTYVGFIALLYRNLHNITCNIKGLFSSVIDMQKVIDILDTPADVIEKKVGIFLSSDENTKITFSNVTFSYMGCDPIINNCSLEINIGDKIIVSGSSGIGKSTFCKLLTAIYKPCNGDIEIFGCNTKNMAIDSLPVGIESICQDSSLYNATIGENLNLYGQAPSLFTDFFKGRLNERVRDYGSNLSNGERQRILLARSLVKPLKMIVLDEIFNSLEKESSIDYLKFIFDKVPTVILVTHQDHMISFFEKELSFSKDGIKLRFLK